MLMHHISVRNDIYYNAGRFCGGNSRAEFRE